MNVYDIVKFGVADTGNWTDEDLYSVLIEYDVDSIVYKAAMMVAKDRYSMKVKYPEVFI